jgi:hypothetical protein
MNKRAALNETRTIRHLLLLCRQQALSLNPCEVSGDQASPDIAPEPHVWNNDAVRKTVAGPPG